MPAGRSSCRQLFDLVCLGFATPFFSSNNGRIHKRGTMHGFCSETIERLLLTYHPEEVPSTTDEPTPSVNEPNTLPADEISPNIEPAPPSNLDGGDLLDSGDLLGLNSNGYHDASAIEDANALALAIVPSDGSTLDSS